MEPERVLYVGHGKTGTSSFGTACEVLGYKLVENESGLTKKVNAGDLDEVLEIADKYTCYEDYPWLYLYKEFDERYDNIKFVLGVRPEEEWFKSMSYQAMRPRTVERRQEVDEAHYNQYVRYMDDPKYFPLKHDEAIAMYLKWNEDIKKYFEGRDDFMVFSVWQGHGWKELCEFLDKPVPDLPFPYRKNAWPYPNYDRLYRMARAHPDRFFGW